MLLGFSCKNFKTYREEAIFSLIPEQIREHSKSLLAVSLAGKIIKALPTSVIYGPNAAGKTNLIAGMDFLRCIVLSGNIQNIQNFNSTNPVVNNPWLAPNLQAENDPVEFCVEFVAQNLKIEYMIEIDIHREKDSHSEGNNLSSQVISERLTIADKNIFVRKGEHLEFNIESIQNFLINNWDKNTLDMARGNVQRTELFLCNGFKSYISQKITEIILTWFRSKFRTFYGFHQIQSYPASMPNEKFMPLSRELEGAVRNFGINQNPIAFYRNNQLPVPLKISFVKNEPIPSLLYESLGTLRFLDMFPLIIDAFRYGQTLVFDEFDASIHPSAVKSIINAFHNEEINTKRAQLIFNTHNPIFLDRKLFRRDEIKFVDRNDETGESELYQLSDFRNEKGNSRKDPRVYLNNYFVHRYGAIREVDFTSSLRGLDKSEKDNAE